ncbi:hypothetical protein OKW41_006199 [Paraburkholderia sp. UCT70]
METNKPPPAVPEDFPWDTTPASLGGAQPKLALRRMPDGRFVSGLTPEERFGPASYATRVVAARDQRKPRRVTGQCIADARRLHVLFDERVRNAAIQATRGVPGAVDTKCFVDGSLVRRRHAFLELLEIGVCFEK